jgi:hypothetical protein
MKILPLVLFIIAMGYALVRLSRKKSAGESRYERKPKNTWNALSEGEDPTV